MQGGVELAVPAARQVLADSFGAGNLDRGDAGVASESRCRRESAGASGACQHPGGDAQPDSIDRDQVAAIRADRLGDLSGDEHVSHLLQTPGMVCTNSI